MSKTNHCGAIIKYLKSENQYFYVETHIYWIVSSKQLNVPVDKLPVLILSFQTSTDLETAEVVMHE